MNDLESKVKLVGILILFLGGGALFSAVFSGEWLVGIAGVIGLVIGAVLGSAGDVD